MNSTVVDLLERNADHADEFASRFDDVQDSQRPAAVTVCCADSRVLQDRMWENDEPGHVFTCANIGNRVCQRTDAGEVVSGDILYPLVHTDTETAVVIGHTGCGAVTAAYDAITDDSAGEPAGIEHCIEMLIFRLEAGIKALPRGVNRTEAIDRLVEYNVDRQVAALLGSDDVPDGVDVVGVVYDFQDVYDGRRGAVHVVNIGGETDVDTLRDAHPAVAARIDRQWTY